jgi:glycosyltransferase involved in cell wall biosynthesis
MNDLLTVVIRTMPGREKFLDKCLFILSGQSHEHIEVVIVAQQLKESDSVEPIRQVGARWASSFQRLEVRAHVSATDARARSLNIGKKAATGRYLAFLDDDDKVYPDHYRKLVESLQKTDYAWAYADIIRALYNEFGQLTSRTSPFKRDAYSYLDHLRGNFVPIHSFVIDLSRARDIGEVDEQMSRNEDYEYILRLAFKHEPLYVPGFGAEYCIRSDGSNTVSDGTGSRRHRVQKMKLWNAAQEALDDRKLENFGWWIKELDQLPIVYPVRPEHSSVTYSAHAADHGFPGARRALVEYYASTSWRISRPFRNIGRWIKRLPPEKNVIPNSDIEAAREIEQILRSTSWELTAPIRVLKRIISRSR